MKRTTLLAVLLAGCTFQPGSAFGTLDRVSLTVSWPMPAARKDDLGRWKTDNDYRLQIEQFTLTVSELTFSAAGSGGGAAATGGTFDPANPPSGYSLCHNGHCHRSDGALVDYETIQAELSGGTASAPRPAVRLPITWQPSLIGAPQTLTWMPAGTQRELTRSTWTQAALRFGELQASGTVTDALAGRGWPGGALRWTLTLSPPVLQETINVPIDRTHPSDVKVTGVLKLADQLFDGIAWSGSPNANDTLDLSASPEAVARIQRQFGESDLSFSFGR